MEPRPKEISDFRARRLHTD